MYRACINVLKEGGFVKRSHIHIWVTLLIITFGFAGCGGCGGDEEKPGSPQAAPAGGAPGSGATGPTAAASPGKTSAAAPATAGTSVASQGNAKRVDTGGALNLLNAPLHEYFQDVSGAYEGLNIEYFLNYTGMLFPSQVGTSTEVIKYTPETRDSAARFLKSLAQKQPISSFEQKALNKSLVLAAITDMQRRWYGYLSAEDQNKIQLDLVETAREGSKVLLRFVLTFIVPNVGRQLDGGLLLLDQSASGTNAWLIRDTVMSSSVSLVQKGSTIVGLSFKGVLRNGKTAEAIFVVGDQK